MIYKQIREELKEAMLAKDTLKTSVLRGLLAAFVNELVAQKRKPQEELSNDEVLMVIKKAVKQRKDSIEQFEKGGRNDLAEKEKAELIILEKYLPKMMSKEEIKKVAIAKKEALGVTDKNKTGVLMGSLMKDLQGKADGADVKEVVEGLFQ